MGNGLLSLFVAAGTAAFVYSKMAPRLGYGNAKNVWTVVGVTFVLTFLVIFILLKTLISLD